MGFIKGQQLLYMGPETGMRLVDFVEPDEGWCKIRFADESEASVRPSYVRPLNDRTVEIVIDAYAKAIGVDPLQAASLRVLVDRVADAVRYKERGMIDSLHAAEFRSVQG